MWTCTGELRSWAVLTHVSVGWLVTRLAWHAEHVCLGFLLTHHHVHARCHTPRNDMTAHGTRSDTPRHATPRTRRGEMRNDTGDR